MLVVPADERGPGDPRLEARIQERGDAFAVRPWDETDDPIAIVAGLVQGARRRRR
jgi:hypothetical protein